jgi:hypothetical protein
MMLSTDGNARVSWARISIKQAKGAGNRQVYVGSQ